MLLRSTHADTGHRAVGFDNEAHVDPHPGHGGAGVQQAVHLPPHPLPEHPGRTAAEARQAVGVGIGRHILGIKPVRTALQRQIETQFEIGTAPLAAAVGGSPQRRRRDRPLNLEGEIRIAETGRLDLAHLAFPVHGERHLDPSFVPAVENLVGELHVPEHPVLEVDQSAALKFRQHRNDNRFYPRQLEVEINRKGEPDPHGLAVQLSWLPAGRPAHDAQSGLGERRIGRRQHLGIRNPPPHALRCRR